MTWLCARYQHCQYIDHFGNMDAIMATELSWLSAHKCNRYLYVTYIYTYRSCVLCSSLLPCWSMLLSTTSSGELGLKRRKRSRGPSPTACLVRVLTIRLRTTHLMAELITLMMTERWDYVYQYIYQSMVSKVCQWLSLRTAGHIRVFLSIIGEYMK